MPILFVPDLGREYAENGLAFVAAVVGLDFEP